MILKTFSHFQILFKTNFQAYGSKNKKDYETVRLFWVIIVGFWDRNKDHLK